MDLFRDIYSCIVSFANTSLLWNLRQVNQLFRFLVEKEARFFLDKELFRDACERGDFFVILVNLKAKKWQSEFYEILMDYFNISPFPMEPILKDDPTELHKMFDRIKRMTLMIPLRNIAKDVAHFMDEIMKIEDRKEWVAQLVILLMDNRVLFGDASGMNYDTCWRKFNEILRRCQGCSLSAPEQQLIEEMRESTIRYHYFKGTLDEEKRNKIKPEESKIWSSIKQTKERMK